MFTTFKQLPANTINAMLIKSIGSVDRAKIPADGYAIKSSEDIINSAAAAPTIPPIM